MMCKVVSRGWDYAYKCGMRAVCVHVHIYVSTNMHVLASVYYAYVDHRLIFHVFFFYSPHCISRHGLSLESKLHRFVQSSQLDVSIHPVSRQGLRISIPVQVKVLPGSALYLLSQQLYMFVAVVIFEIDPDIQLCTYLSMFNYSLKLVTRLLSQSTLN